MFYILKSPTSYRAYQTMLSMKHLHSIEAWLIDEKLAKFKKNWVAKDSKKGDFQKTAWVFASDDSTAASGLGVAGINQV